MKKSKFIILSAAFIMAAAGCQQNDDQWISGKDRKDTRDSTFHGSSFRYYNGFWYPIYHGMISPSTYRGASYQQVSSPHFTPVHISTESASGFHSGGFGSSAHSFGSIGG